MDTIDASETLSSPPSPESNEHLSFPATLAESPAESSSAPAAPPRQLLKDRLYVGNLHPSVDEYALLQVFSKFGKVTKLDFLFHKAGALKGKPRGYAFVEYDSSDVWNMQCSAEARKALSMAHDKLLRGRKLVVTFAHQAPVEQVGGGIYGPKRRSMMETGRPTTLSLLKTGAGARNDGTRDKIAMMEAKLRQMERTNPKPAPVSMPDPSSSSAASTSQPTSTTTTTPLYHASLPLKPPPTIPQRLAQSKARPAATAKPKAPLPSLPILPPSQGQARAALSTDFHMTTRPAKAKLTGVKIGKPRDKVGPSEKG
ncbi:hypothetical protein D9615_005485 [Tricholomella constricta]|uniref:Probable RNA-binding protein 18 n=1 Tax=Tricholomella constricta TaxID=117010 RepID=A0A8H5HE50_9AGAR|nr:hypothetical protein D9615_005485 [Tricholomella constricta]